MVDDVSRLPSSGSLSRDEVAGRTFRMVRRGFDPEEVRSFLDRVAGELTRGHDREASLRRQTAEAEGRAAHPELDEATLAAALGQETARILRSAHEAAAGVRSRAEDSVAAILRDAHEQAAAFRAESETVLATRTAEANEAAAAIRGGAEADTEAVLAGARQQADESMEAVRAECRSMIEEAQELRAKVLSDLARRRRVMHTQVEQLRAAREALLETFREAKRAIDVVHEGLQRAETDARLSAEAAARRVAAEPEASVEDLEAAIVQARDLEAIAPAPAVLEERRISSVRILRPPAEEAAASSPPVAPAEPVPAPISPEQPEPLAEPEGRPGVEE
ncbi:MAG TPA: DivIVA domain-containing protein, partial [Acidimicrobiales bacterium]